MASTTSSERPVDAQRSGVIAAIGVVVFLACWLTIHHGFYARHVLPDTPLYQAYGEAMADDHRVPYRDFAMVYPPGALPVFVVPSLVVERGNYHSYRRIFEALMAACGAAIVWLVAFALERAGASQKRLVGGVALVAVSPLFLGSLMLNHFDLWPAALTAGALAALAAGRLRLGSGVLGLAVAAKIYPVVLLPIVLAQTWRRRGPREAALCAGVFVAVVVVCFLPFFAIAPHEVWISVTDQWRRPLQIESLGASLLLAAHQAFGTSVTVITTYGSQNLAGSAPDTFQTLQTVLLIVALLAIWFRFARGRPVPDQLFLAAAAALCAAVALGKVLSPQFMIWLLPVAGLVAGRRGLAFGGMYLLSMLLTQLWFPYRYPQLAFGLDPTASWLVFARDLLLVAMLVTLLWPVRRSVGRSIR